jgi:hypothetical protein
MGMNFDINTQIFAQNYNPITNFLVYAKFDFDLQKYVDYFRRVC